MRSWRTCGRNFRRRKRRRACRRRQARDRRLLYRGKVDIKSMKHTIDSNGNCWAKSMHRTVCMHVPHSPQTAPPQIARVLKAPSTSGASAAAPPLLRTPTTDKCQPPCPRDCKILSRPTRRQKTNRQSSFIIQAAKSNNTKYSRQVGTYPSRKRCGRASMRAPRSAAGGPRRSRPEIVAAHCQWQHSSSRESDAIKSAVMAHIGPCKLTA